MTISDKKISVAALYRFAPLPNYADLQPGLQRAAHAAGVKGSLLLASEGINGTIAGPPAGVEAVIATIRAVPGLEELDVKYASAPRMPFRRLKVRLKREIVTMGVAGIDPRHSVGTYVEPEDWNALIRDPGTLVIDTRNDYEVAIGTFERAVDPGTSSFREFPEWIERYLQQAGGARPQRIAMFCTGGIRCEKATAFVRQLGFDDVHHLKGGILRYLEQVPEADSSWTGACYVFDERVAVGHGLTPAAFKLCRACGSPIAVDDGAGGGYLEGICTSCDERRRARDAG